MSDLILANTKAVRALVPDEECCTSGTVSPNLSPACEESRLGQPGPGVKPFLSLV
jgi:hypothetical protein